MGIESSNPISAARDFLNDAAKFAEQSLGLQTGTISGILGDNNNGVGLDRFRAQPGASYTVKRGDTLSAIAQRFGTTTSVLARLNNITNPNLISPNQQIRLPAGAQSSHVVQRGETLSKIAAASGISVDALRAANPQIANPNRIYPGDNISIPAATAQRPQARPAANAPDGAAPVAPQTRQNGAPASGTINLGSFLDASRGSQAQAAIIIGNAEGTRTPTGGTTRAYGGHIDPGNSVANRGSFSLQNAGSRTPVQADQFQLGRLAAQRPAYEAAARRAGLDPNNATLATAYFDLFNQSQTAAGRFLNQMGRLSQTGISQQSVTQLRVDSFINPTTGRRYPGAAGGFINIARKANGGREPSTAQILQTVQNDQSRRQRSMATAMTQQGISGKTAPAASPRAAQVSAGRVDGNTIARENGVGIKGPSVRIGNMDGRLAPVISAVAQAARTLGLPNPVITSGNDSGHKRGSLHYVDRALDFRGNNISIADGQRLQAEVNRILGSGYDVIFETFSNRSNNHLHVEFDPN